jgi:acetyl-CoA C-acetyltransferase
MQDEWACRSQKLYDEAFKAGKFENEIVPIELPQKKGDPLFVKDDQSPRPTTTIEALAKLKPVNQSPTITAGNAPGLSTGAALVLLMNGEEAKKRGVKPLATIIAHAQASEHPKGIAYIPAYAAKKALKKAGMSIDQMDVIEINEAFAAMPLVSTILLGDKDEARIASIREKTNVNGGAIAIGHPTGASGARLLMTLAYELRRRGGGHGLCTICGGVGESESFIIKV